MNDILCIIFEKNKEKKEIKKEGDKLYYNLKDYIQKEIDENKENNIMNCKNNNNNEIQNEEEDENEEERIKKVISGDKEIIELNLNSQLDLLLKKLKLNSEAVEIEKELEKIKSLDGEFFYNSWLKSFEKVEIKRNPKYQKYVNVKESPSLANMGYYIKKLLDNFNIDIFCEEPSKLDKRLKK